jgi:hypothetical protein
VQRQYVGSLMMLREKKVKTLKKLISTNMVISIHVISILLSENLLQDLVSYFDVWFSMYKVIIFCFSSKIDLCKY